MVRPNRKAGWLQLRMADCQQFVGRETLLTFHHVLVENDDARSDTRRRQWFVAVPRACSLETFPMPVFVLRMPFLRQQTRPIQLAELCRWLLKTDIRLSACFSMDMQNTGLFGGLSKVEAQTTLSESGSEPGSGPGSGPGPASTSTGDGGEGTSSSSLPHGGKDESPGTGPGVDTPTPRVCWRRPLSGTLAEPPPPGSISQKFAAHVLPDLRLMSHVVQR